MMTRSYRYEFLFRSPRVRLKGKERKNSQSINRLKGFCVGNLFCLKAFLQVITRQDVIRRLVAMTHGKKWNRKDLSNVYKH